MWPVAPVTNTRLTCIAYSIVELVTSEPPAERPSMRRVAPAPVSLADGYASADTAAINALM
jgi:hypothetical protein